MAGKPKEGLNFSGWSVDVFEDPKIDKLMDAQGCKGFLIYFYLCQRAFKLNGYFLRWTYDDSASVARRIGGGVGHQTVRDTVGLCLQVGLFDNKLFEEHGILTSRGIQRSFVPIFKKRRAKSVIAEYWLLNTDESGGAVLVPQNAM